MEVLSNSTAQLSRKFVPISIEVQKRAGVLSFLFIIVHIPLALLMHSNAQFSTIHCYVVLAVGFAACIAGRLDIAAAAAAYITGAEVLWRMTDASVFWEYAKYSTVAIFTLGLIRSGIRNSGLPFLYFAFLVPSTILTVEALSPSLARNEISFNLSGPLALFVSACFFSGLSFTKYQRVRIFIAMLAPIVGIGAIAAFTSFSTKSVYFGHGSNFVTSGGFGPNQVSAMLGLGAATAILCLMAARSTKFLKLVLIILGTILLAQSSLTFSRGGVFMAVSSIVVGTLMLVRQPRRLVAVLFGSLVIVSALYFVIFPWLDSFTGGALVERFRDTGSTGRIEIIEDELKIWAENPILGAGPGKAKASKFSYQVGAISHTEYSRMLSEHGTFGLAAIVILIAMAVRNFLRAKTGEEKAVVSSLLFWSLAYMSVNAMRLVAPSFLIGLSSAVILDDDENPILESEMDQEKEA